MGYTNWGNEKLLKDRINLQIKNKNIQEGAVQGYTIQKECIYSRITSYTYFSQVLLGLLFSSLQGRCCLITETLSTPYHLNFFSIVLQPDKLFPSLLSVFPAIKASYMWLVTSVPKNIVLNNWFQDIALLVTKIKLLVLF